MFFSDYSYTDSIFKSKEQTTWSANYTQTFSIFIDIVIHLNLNMTENKSTSNFQ